MYCHNCGAEIPETAAFCHKCGAKISDKNVRQPLTETSIETKKTDGVQASNVTGQQPYIAESVRRVQSQIQNVSGNQFQRKKPKNKLVTIGTIILGVIIAIIIALNWEGKADYVAIVAKHTPFEDTQGLPYTYEEVLNKYLVSAEWKVREEGDAHYVDISGKTKGIEDKLKITIRVSPNPDFPDSDIALIQPESVTADDTDQIFEGEAVDFLYDLFCLYDEGYEDLSVLMEPENKTESILKSEVELTESFIDEEAGISFRYPDEWVILDPSNEFHIVEMIDSGNTPDHIATFDIRVIFDPDPFGVFTQDEASVREAVNEYHTFLDLRDTLIGDVPVKILRYQTRGLKSQSITTNFFYKIGENVYQVICSYTASTADIYEPIFAAMMDSYIISTPMSENPGVESYASDADIRFNDIPVSELLGFSVSEVIQTFGDDYYAGADGEIVYDEIGFYMLDVDTVSYITSFYPENFSINGYSLDDGSGEGVYSDRITDLLGSDYEEEYLDWYYITYHYPTYTVSFSVSKFNEVGNIKIYSSLYEQNGLTDDILSEFQEPIEQYWRLSGFYNAGIGQSTLSISIYSSQEEGETEIGSVEIYADDGQYFVGTLIPIEEGTYEVMTDTGEKVLLIESPSDYEVILQMYVDGQYLEEYQMTEHYEY